MVNADIRPLAFQCVSRRGCVLGPKGVNWGYPPKHHFGVTFWYAKSMGRLGSVLGSLLGSVLGPRFGTSFQYTLPWQGVSDLSVQKGVPFWDQKRVQKEVPSKHRISINNLCINLCLEGVTFGVVLGSLLGPYFRHPVTWLMPIKGH